MIHTLFLHFAHRSFRIWLNIIVANQMEDAMDEIEKSLFIGADWIEAKGCNRADKNIPQIGILLPRTKICAASLGYFTLFERSLYSVDWKGDAIGWAWVVKEFSM